jgi:uncharacterized protein YneF (UPF0154 family)
MDSYSNKIMGIILYYTSSIVLLLKLLSILCGFITGKILLVSRQQIDQSLGRN